MSCYFTESSEMGKLYLNYPMVEAFYHMKSIPDENYTSYLATWEELRNHTYKSRVQRENRNHSYQKFAINKAECDVVIWQNIQKAWCVAENRLPTLQSPLLPDLIDVLLAQIEHMRERQAVMILCTCAFYVVDYNPNLLNKQDDGVKNACIMNRPQSL